MNKKNELVRRSAATALLVNTVMPSSSMGRRIIIVLGIIAAIIALAVAMEKL